jgi:peptide deformylase
MALRQILTYDKDEILRKKSRRVETVDDRIKTLVEDMAETMEKANGAGLAAPQIGILKRIVVVDTGEGLMKLINPEIVKAEGQQLEVEGCLSVPGLYGIVKRPFRVYVRAMDENGQNIGVYLRGLAARAVCHEVDHLEGILFLDKVEPNTLKNALVNE